MFCPKCAAQNIDGASFCRVCGANISLIPQALSGRLPEAQPEGDPSCLPRRARKRRNRDEDAVPASLEKGIVNIFAGLGFLVAALAVIFRFPGGFTWGWVFFFPGFSFLGRGVASVVAARRNPQTSLPAAFERPSISGPAPLATSSLPVMTGPARRNTGELVQSPPSVTEGTTRHLGVEAPTRLLDSVK